MPAPWLLALALVVGLLVLIPARRLHTALVDPRVIALYALGLWALAMLVAIRPIGARFLIPILLIAYLAPFVAAPEQVRRVLYRGKPPMKNVTPHDGDKGND
jgi:hypothetical protein